MKTFYAIMIVGLTFTLSGCAGFAFQGVNQGFVYASSNRNQMVTEAEGGSKQGEACASSILGWITTGDASAVAAAKSAGISQIMSVDNTFSNVLGIYAKYCTVVTGE